MIRYKATAPAANIRDPKTGEPVKPFKGKTCGVQFNDNVAFFDELSVSKFIGMTPEQIANSLVGDFGYTVVQIDEHGKESQFIPTHESILVTEKIDMGAKPVKKKVAA